MFENDSLLEGGEKGEMTNDITYSEVNVLSLYIKESKSNASFL